MLSEKPLTGKNTLMGNFFQLWQKITLLLEISLSNNKQFESLHIKRNAAKQEVKLVGGCGQGRRADRGDLLKVVESGGTLSGRRSHQYQAGVGDDFLLLKTDAGRWSWCGRHVRGSCGMCRWKTGGRRGFKVRRIAHGFCRLKRCRKSYLYPSCLHTRTHKTVCVHPQRHKFKLSHMVFSD